VGEFCESSFLGLYAGPVEKGQRVVQPLRELATPLLDLNFPGFGEEKEDLVRAAYGSNYERLTQIKAKYDPTNLFRMNQNIRPATET
jgi:hypothetical protein